MKIAITQPNTKGQVVIPKKIRDTLGIESGTPLHVAIKNGGVFLKPLRDVDEYEEENSFLHILKKTQGAWRNENLVSMEKRRRGIELASTKKRKTAW